MPVTPVTPDGLTLPLFLTTRQSIRRTKINELKEHIFKQSELYIKKCEEGKVKMRAEHRRFIQRFNDEKAKKPPTSSSSCLKGFGRSMLPLREPEDKDVKMSPNMFKFTEEPFASFKGFLGKMLVEEVTPPKPLDENKLNALDLKFYPKKSFVDELCNRCNNYKGKLSTSNVRRARPSSRCMVSDLSLCHHDPKEPGPTSYYSRLHEISYNAPKKKRTKPFLGSVFYPNTTVPVTKTFIHQSNTKFTPGPTSYEQRYKPGCPCTPRLKYMPELDLLIDEQKRIKFRRQPWRVIRRKEYCSPDFKHVKGEGVARHFIRTTKVIKEFEKMQLRDKKRATASTTNTSQKMYADAPYFQMINHTSSRIDDKWIPPLPRRQLKLKYNSVLAGQAKKKRMSLLRIGFSSAAPRPICGKKKKPLSAAVVAKIRAQLPRHLRSVHKPVTKVPLGIIESKYAAEKPRRHTFKFSKVWKYPALPGPTRLVKDRETKIMPGEAKPYFRTVLSHKDFMKHKNVAKKSTRKTRVKISFRSNRNK